MKAHPTESSTCAQCDAAVAISLQGSAGAAAKVAINQSRAAAEVTINQSRAAATAGENWIGTQSQQRTRRDPSERQSGESSHTAAAAHPRAESHLAMRVSPIAQRLFNASRDGNTEEAKRLIEIKAPVDWQNPDGDDEGETALWVASWKGNTDTARLLIESKAAVDKADKGGASPLYTASAWGKTDTVRLLIEGKAAVDKAEKDGATPLHAASQEGKTDTARLLIESKTAVDKAQKDGATPLLLASYGGETNTARLLIESKAAVDKAMNNGDTPLIIAAYKNRMTTVRLLVESGADTTIRGDENKTAAEWAEQRGHHPIAEYLDTVRFQPSARNESGELHKEQGRAERAATRDLVDIAGLDRDMIGLLNQFCTGMR